MAILQLAEAIGSAAQEVAREPQSAHASESIGWMIEQIDQFLASPEMAQAHRIPPDLRPSIAAMSPKLFDGLRHMLSVAIQIEQKGGRAPWGAPLAQAIERLETTFARVGLAAEPSRTPPPLVVVSSETGPESESSFMVTDVTLSAKTLPLERPDRHSLIQLLVACATRDRGAVSRIRLIKFLYLGDVHAFHRMRQTLTGYRWRFYHYGPWALEAQADIDECASAGLIEADRVPQDDGGEVWLYRSSGWLPPVLAAISPTLEALVRNEVSEWVGEPLPRFLDYVYFDTPPMRDAKRGEYLEFRPETFPPAESASPAPRRRYSSRESRRAFQRLLDERRHVGDRVTVPQDAIADDAYAAALEQLDSQDRLTGPIEGQARIEPE